MDTVKKFAYMNNTNTNIDAYHKAIMAAIANGGTFDENLNDIFVLTKTPDGSAGEYILNFL